MRWLGEYLQGKGYTVYCPRLSGHGTNPKDLIGRTWRDWYTDLVAGHALLRDHCDQVFVVGLSMGGSLTMLYVAYEPVAGFVAMSAPYAVRNPLLPLLPLLRPFVKTLPKTHLPPPDQDEFSKYVLAEQRRRGEPLVGEPGYDVWVTSAVIEIARMLAEMRAALPRISAPGLLIHSTRDRTVPFENLQHNFDHVGSTHKEKIILEQSEHVITRHLEHELVFRAVADFIAGQANVSRSGT